LKLRCEKGLKAREKEIIVVDRNSYHMLIVVDRNSYHMLISKGEAIKATTPASYIVIILFFCRKHRFSTHLDR